MVRFSFIFATIFFILMRYINIPYLNILCILLAQMSIGSASSLLCSIYIPSQGKSGMISALNGILNFSGYLFAAAANIIFAHAISGLGWNGIISLWMIMAVAGVIVAIIAKDDK